MPANRVLLFYKSGASNINWCMLDKDNQRQGDMKTSQLASLAADTDANDYIVVFPGEDLSMRSVTVPRASGINAGQLIPNILEEGLVEDIEQLHFVSVRQGNDDQYSVCVVNKEKLAQCIQVLTGAGISAAVIIPEPLLIPWNQGQWVLVVDKETAMLRTTAASACKVTVAELNLLLPALIKEQGKPQSIELFTADDQASDIPLLSETGISIVRHEIEDKPKSWFKSIEPAILKYNLLNDFRHESLKRVKSFFGYRYALIFFVLAVVVMFSAQVYQYSRLVDQQARLDSSITETFKQTFPDVKRVIDPVVQAQQQLLKRQSSAKADGGFLELFYLLGSIVKADSSLQLTDFQYQNARMTFTISTQSISKVENLRVQLQRIATIKTQVLSTRNEDNQVIAKMRLTVKEGA